MFNTSTLRSRRAARRNHQVEQPIIAFKLGSEWFGLPILAVQKVVPTNQINCIVRESQNNLYQYKNQELLIINVEQHIFGNSSPLKSEALANSNSFKSEELDSLASVDYVAILQQETDILVGLPLNSQPVIYKVKPSDFQVLSPTEILEHSRQYIDSKITNIDEIPCLFILNLQQLLQIPN